MRILVVGSGAREHALAWRLALAGHELHAAPGNPGIARVAQCHDAGASDVEAQVALARALAVELVVVGPEAPLALGLVDALAAQGIAAFGPTRAAARLESSKAFAKEFMARHRIPTAAFKVARSVGEALEAAALFGYPCVLKADGLAAGKGVVVAATEGEARLFARLCLEDAHFGEAGQLLVVEQFLPGEEASLFFLADGTRVRRFPPARDFKRLLAGGSGPNTGGMGAYAPAPLPPALCDRIEAEVALPTLAGMATEGAPFRGLLYVGLMIGPYDVRVLEYNARFGDPETQVLLPLLESDPADLFAACARGTLEGDMRFADEAAVGVVLAAPGYPDAPRPGGALRGLDAWPAPEEEDARATWCFHAGTKAEGKEIVAAAGRVLTMVARRSTLPEARAAAYEALQAVTLEGGQSCPDIAFETLTARR